jgi:hypothetical protein
MPKVTMSLTDRDVANTGKIRSTVAARSNAHAVSIALSLTGFLVDQLQKQNELLLRSPGGEMFKVVMAELALSPVSADKSGGSDQRPANERAGVNVKQRT